MASALAAHRPPGGAARGRCSGHQSVYDPVQIGVKQPCSSRPHKLGSRVAARMAHAEFGPLATEILPEEIPLGNAKMGFSAPCVFRVNREQPHTQFGRPTKILPPRSHVAARITHTVGAGGPPRRAGRAARGRYSVRDLVYDPTQIGVKQHCSSHPHALGRHVATRATENGTATWEGGDLARGGRPWRGRCAILALAMAREPFRVCSIPTSASQSSRWVSARTPALNSPSSMSALLFRWLSTMSAFVGTRRSWPCERRASQAGLGCPESGVG